MIVYERVLRPADKQHRPWLERYTVQLASALQALDAMAPTGWAGDEHPNQADITAGCALGYLRLRLPEALPAGRYPALERWSAACEALPAFSAYRPAADEVMPARPL